MLLGHLMSSLKLTEWFSINPARVRFHANSSRTTIHIDSNAGRPWCYPQCTKAVDVITTPVQTMSVSMSVCTAESSGMGEGKDTQEEEWDNMDGMSRCLAEMWMLKNVVLLIWLTAAVMWKKGKGNGNTTKRLMRSRKRERNDQLKA